MPDAGPTSERLEALQERWQAEPDSRVFLQLADEYRRLGRTEEAARVLEEGVAANPHHLAAQVALGRCRLDLGAPDEAARLLERVVESDPTQMVAYRLLVEAYLRQGRAEEARQRLRIYSLLNDADPEIAELRRRIGEIDRGRAEGPAGARVEAEPEDTSAEPLLEPEEPEEPPASAAGNGDPFPDLAKSSARRRYLEGLAAGELFEPEEEAPGAEAPPSDQVFDLGAPAGAPGPDLSSLLEPNAQPDREAAAEPGWELAPPERAPEAPEPAPGASARPTVTLGRLYLRQGHTREAEEIFREVLAREPGNDEARRHLEELERPPQAAAPPPPEPPSPAEEPPPPGLEARDLLTGYPGNEGLTGRKRYVLERYLERLRGRARRHVH